MRREPVGIRAYPSLATIKSVARGDQAPPRRRATPHPRAARHRPSYEFTGRSNLGACASPLLLACCAAGFGAAVMVNLLVDLPALGQVMVLDIAVSISTGALIALGAWAWIRHRRGTT